MIRRAEEGDIGGITELEHSALLHPWDIGDIERLVSSEGKNALVYEEDGAIVGYIGYSLVLDEAEIGNICVLDRYRRRGIASALLDAVGEDLRRRGAATVFLEVEDGNDPAKALYLKKGFEVISVRRDYYGAGRDAHIMRWIL